MVGALVVAALIGAAIAVQVGIIGGAASRFHVLAVSMALQIAGLTAAALWATARSGWGEVFAIARTWWWVPLGILGWVIVAGLGFASARAGVAAVLAVSVSSQLVAGLVIDQRAGTTIGLRGVAGAILLAAGAALVVQR